MSESTQRSRISGIDPWRTLEALSFYRAALCVALLALGASDYRPPYFDGGKAEIVDALLYLYLFLSALLLISVRGQQPSATWQAVVHIGSDLSVIIALVFFSQGVASGIGALLVTPVAAGSLLLSRRFSVVPPAIATIALLAIEIYLNWKVPIYAENYTQTGMLGAGLFVIAITGNALARRARESEARASRAQSDIAKLAMLSESVIQKLQAGVVVVNAEGQIELLNRAARNLLGAGAAAGRHLSACAPTVWQRLNHWRQDPSALTNTALSLSNNQSAWAQFTRLGAGSDASALIVLDDASRVAEQAQSMKLASLGRLTASIAHEVRNPLAAIQNAAELASESSTLAAEDLSLLDIVKRQSRRLEDIVTSVLNLSRKTTSPASNTELKPMVDDAIRDFVQRCEAPAPLISCSITPANLAIAIEPVQFAQIMNNLLGNALTHALEPGKALEITLEARISADGNQALIDLFDNGPGIDRETAKHVFEPFFSTQHSGTGLGLFITRELCTAAHGDLQLINHDAPERGAYFRLSFPAALTGP